MVFGTTSEHPEWRSIPLILSCTSADMSAEREHLFNYSFPELRNRLAERKHNLFIINPGWSVESSGTDKEMEKEIRLLKLCLGEINLNKAFLVALLGDRYGMVRRKSIPALGIEGGVLNKRDPQKRSHFYLRESLPYHEMPHDVAALYSDEFAGNPEASRLLKKLKQRINNNNQLKDRVRLYHARWDAGSQKVIRLEDFGKMVLDDLWRELQVALEGPATEPEMGKKQASVNLDREKDLVITYGRLGEIYSELGNKEDAEDTFRIFLDRARKLAFQNPGNSGMLRFLFVACIKNAGILSEQCEYSKAQLAHQAAFFIAEQYLEKNPVDAAWLMNNWKAFDYVRKLRKLEGNINDQSGN